ncbi:MAG: hypothetical protein A3B38_00805 [Candidatus Levybacteria bacterium RIFCSPLOWO2_01_FULL_36_13]|nr:MAG: hypothetical protein A2684_02045 [Candidatus Levybacteria bacterium RIFCSPHIGHO2_01_FULL_36_15b]OGH35428.1 MAG: hypothetical protein A3B38_00805 [Candidatus Levybacteria bacterium RIFCSPLOWO2_01_FULL_36_13]
MRLVLIDKKSEQRNISTFIFKPEKKIKWTSGQYLIYSLPHQKNDLRGKQRFFTISSAPHQNYPSITTRIEKKPSSFKTALNKLKVGEEIFVKGPDGDFILDKKSKINIFIAGGIGITPFIAILRDLVFKKMKNEVLLLYANKNNNILFKKELDKISKKNKNIQIKYFIGSAKIDKNVLKRVIKKNIDIFISGPDPMVAKMEETVKKLGVKEENIKLDYFSGYKNI